MKVIELFETEEKKAIDKLKLAVQDLKLPKELPVAQGETVDERRRSFMKHVTQVVGSKLLPISVTGEIAALAVPQLTAALQAAVVAPAAAIATDAKLAQAITGQVTKTIVQHTSNKELMRLVTDSSVRERTSLKRPSIGQVSRSSLTRWSRTQEP